jgi:hypothetical protein
VVLLACLDGGFAGGIDTAVVSGAEHTEVIALGRRLFAARIAHLVQLCAGGDAPVTMEDREALRAVRLEQPTITDPNRRHDIAFLGTAGVEAGALKNQP